MKGIVSIILNVILAICLAPSICAATKVISCPLLTAAHYGKTTYYNSQTQGIWHLTWLQHKSPIWNSASIPQTKACKSGQFSKGMPLTYQCVILQCQSDAVIASTGQDGKVKCFSTYVSAQNKFYCEAFSMR